MRRRDWRTLTGLVLMGIAVWIAAWLLSFLGDDGSPAATPADAGSVHGG